MQLCLSRSCTCSYPNTVLCTLQPQVAVALMQQMGVREDAPVNDQARGFAEELMTAWGVGNAACNDGVLLLLSKQPREARTPTQPHSYTSRPG